MRNNSDANVVAPGMRHRSIAEREVQVLGDGPRIGPMTVSELSDDLLSIVQRMARLNTSLQSRSTISLTAEPKTAADLAVDVNELPEIVRTMLRHAELFGKQTDVGIHLLTQGALPPRDRELAILRIGWLCQAPYEWGEHVIVGRKAGVSGEEIERITYGSQAPGWSEHDRAILRATEELHADAMISDATWAVLAKSYDERQLIEFPMLVGQYQAVAYSHNSLRLRLHGGNLGLKAR